MSDLISRKAVIEFLESCSGITTDTIGNCYISWWKMLEVVENAPTAYDVDKVVEELEDAIDCGYEEWLNGVSEYYNSVVDIVKKGGLV